MEMLNEILKLIIKYINIIRNVRMYKLYLIHNIIFGTNKVVISYKI